jgi:hypothetical protein
MSKLVNKRTLLSSSSRTVGLIRHEVEYVLPLEEMLTEDILADSYT